MKRIVPILKTYWRWLFVIVYLCVAAWGWHQRQSLFSLVPVGSDFPFYRLYLVALDVLFLLIAGLGFAGLVNLIHTPPLMRMRFDRAMSRSGLYNALGEYPTLRSVRHDPDKAHGRILCVKNMGITIPDFDKKADCLQIELGGSLYRMEYANRANRTLLYFLPSKYVHPTIITPTDASIGRLDLSQLINMLVIGATGTGKTVLVKILMAKIAKFQPDAHLWLLDFKQTDFKALPDLPRYYGYTDCAQGLNDFYAAFKAQQEAGTVGAPNFLIIDEWGSFILSQDKKQAEQLKAKLAETLMLGRGYRFFPIIGIQRPDAQFFGTARDNFQNILALGNLSPEGKRMVFPDSVVGTLSECKKREGHLYVDGIGLETVVIADIADMDALDVTIREAMCR